MEQYKTGIIRQAEKLFNEPGFIERLDQETMALGVGNGVLLLSQNGHPKLIRTYHNHLISRYTDTRYKVFDPMDPLTRTMLKAFRSMHLDEDTDAFEYMMSMIAAGIDNRPRETIMLLITGPGSNGKSFLFELLKSVLGEMYCVNMPIAMLIQGKEDNGEAPKPFLMKLETARVAYYEEGPTSAILNMPMVKRITGCANLPARNLHENARNIKSRCYHFVLSNHNFVINTHEEAVWRRLRYIWLSIIFKPEIEFDPTNKYHRLMDRSLNADFREREDVKSSFLSILVFFHMKLLRKWGGIVDHVPHPSVDRMTTEFRNTQDRLNKFVSERVVQLVGEGNGADTVSLDSVIQSYVEWYQTTTGKQITFREEVRKQLIDSALGPHLDRTEHGTYLKPGIRVLGLNEKPMDDEVVLGGRRVAAQNKNYGFEFPHETPDEYLLRVEKEWAEMCDEIREEDQSNRVNRMDRAYDVDTDDEERKEDDIDAHAFAKKDEAEEKEEYERIAERIEAQLKLRNHKHIAEGDLDDDSDDEDKKPRKKRDNNVAIDALQMIMNMEAGDGKRVAEMAANIMANRIEVDATGDDLDALDMLF